MAVFSPPGGIIQEAVMANGHIVPAFRVVQECAITKCIVESPTRGISKGLETDGRARADVRSVKPSGNSAKRLINTAVFALPMGLLASAPVPIAVLGPTSTPSVVPRVPPVVLLNSALEPIAVLPKPEVLEKK